MQSQIQLVPLMSETEHFGTSNWQQSIDLVLELFTRKQITKTLITNPTIRLRIRKANHTNYHFGILLVLSQDQYIKISIT
jgi:hypothetical protein